MLLLSIVISAIFLGVPYLFYEIGNLKKFFVIEPGINYVAHLSGFLTGFSSPIFLVRKMRKRKSSIIYAT